MTLEDYRWWQGAWRGRTALITAGGPSLTDHDLRRIPEDVPVLGVNYSFRAVFPDILCGTDRVLYRGAPGVCEYFADMGMLFSPAHATLQLGHLVQRSKEFSADLHKGIKTGATTTYFAVQLALCFGASRIYIMGLDCGPVGGRWHFYDSPPCEPPSELLTKQMAVDIKKVAPDVEVFLVGSPKSRCEGIPHLDFPWGRGCRETEPVKTRMHPGKKPQIWKGLHY